MRFKATKRAMRENYHRIINIGYCGAQYLLNYESPIAYSAGVYGWACDYYDIEGVLISTGYGPLAEKNMKHDYSIVQRYDKEAEKIVHDHTPKTSVQGFSAYSGNTGLIKNKDYLTWEEKRTKVRELLSAFVEEMKI